MAVRLRDAIDKLNPSITQEAREDALKKVLRAESPNLLINNEIFHKYLTDGVDVEVRADGGIRGENIYISLISKIPKATNFLPLINLPLSENLLRVQKSTGLL
ncbi:MAG: hypothetical protein LBI42_03455 [Chitinispirillales bacterium]|nr:hypothetical protein [Chitinispirillales bacterium]